MSDRPTAGGYRPTLPLMRFVLVLGSILTFAAFVQLFGLSSDTHRWFAWTIQIPLTAAFLGAFYLAATVFAYLSWRRPEWARARGGIPGITVFLWGTLVLTVLHADSFHFGEGPGTAQAAAWLWLAIYVLDPLLTTTALYQQWRQPGEDPPGTLPLHPAYRGVLVVYGGIAVLVGAAMFVTPGWVADWWPWPVTDLTSRAMACWALAFGGFILTMAWEDDADRSRPASVALVVLGVFQLLALARYWDDLASGGGRWAYVAGVVLALVLGLLGLLQAAGSGTMSSSGSVAGASSGADGPRPR